MSSTRVNNDQLDRFIRNKNKKSRDENILRPLIREYFEDNRYEIKNKEYVDKIKINENIRIITLNVKGYRLRSNNRIKETRESIEKYQIDVALFNKTNTKKNIRNIDKIEKEMRKIGKGAKAITVDSQQWNMIDNEYLLGGLINVINQRDTLIIEKTKIKRGRLGNQIAILLVCKGKRLEIISMHRIPSSS